jgi:hypothetical protein
MNRLVPRSCKYFDSRSQAPGLPPIELPIGLGIVAHQDLTEGRVECLDVLGEVLVVLEVELVLPTLLGGT